MKTENTMYHVMPIGARWKVIAEGGEPTYHSSEAEAVATARRWAMANETSHLIIHKIDGSIEEEHRMRMGSGAASDAFVTTDRSAQRTHPRDRNSGDRRSQQTGVVEGTGISL